MKINKLLTVLPPRKMVKPLDGSLRQNTGWFSEINASKINRWASGGWFDLPNGWATDAPGILFGRSDGWDTSNDTVIYMDNQPIGEVHTQGNFRGWSSSTLCPQGVWVSWSLATGGSMAQFMYLRMQ